MDEIKYEIILLHRPRIGLTCFDLARCLLTGLFVHVPHFYSTLSKRLKIPAPAADGERVEAGEHGKEGEKLAIWRPVFRMVGFRRAGRSSDGVELQIPACLAVLGGGDSY